MVKVTYIDDRPKTTVPLPDPVPSCGPPCLIGFLTRQTSRVSKRTTFLDKYYTQLLTCQRLRKKTTKTTVSRPRHMTSLQPSSPHHRFRVTTAATKTQINATAPYPDPYRPPTPPHRFLDTSATTWKRPKTTVSHPDPSPSSGSPHPIGFLTGQRLRSL